MPQFEQPEYLYRVQYNRSSSEHIAGRGVLSPSSLKEYKQNNSVDLESVPGEPEDETASDKLKKHMDWYNMDSTPYISTTTVIILILSYAVLRRKQNMDTSMYTFWSYLRLNAKQQNGTRRIDSEE